MCGAIVGLIIILPILAYLLMPVFEKIGEILGKEEENEKFI